MSVVSEQMASDQKVNGSIAQNADDADICGCQTKQSLNKCSPATNEFIEYAIDAVSSSVLTKHITTLR
ncbi:hypothetical protein H9Q09_19840 [Aurantimonas sp. DM33-3]|uniref:hypothetical protein n=1 Tax=Aurantimonas sp. DM33-3 TaxID=2766955 RepID=UPI001652493D|nr:hypothetical protein [Aurantimonas sp. DM33-3]MBC6718439.1 hypothetical protein [Aurantimonas sp. DM33-3]